MSTIDQGEDRKSKLLDVSVHLPGAVCEIALAPGTLLGPVMEMIVGHLGLDKEAVWSVVLERDGWGAEALSPEIDLYDTMQAYPEGVLVMEPVCFVG